MLDNFELVPLDDLRQLATEQAVIFAMCIEVGGRQLVRVGSTSYPYQLRSRITSQAAPIKELWLASIPEQFLPPAKKGERWRQAYEVQRFGRRVRSLLAEHHEHHAVYRAPMRVVDDAFNKAVAA